MYVSMLISLLFQIELRISCSSRNIEIKNNFGKETSTIISRSTKTSSERGAHHRLQQQHLLQILDFTIPDKKTNHQEEV